MANEYPNKKLRVEEEPPTLGLVHVHHLLLDVHNEGRLAEQLALLGNLLLADLELERQLLLLGRVLHEMSQLLSRHERTTSGGGRTW